MNRVYQLIKKFKNKYPGTIAWRLKRHSALVEKYLNKDERLLYAFTGQANKEWYNILCTAVIAITNKRLIIGTKRVVWGYFLTSITPDLFNDLKVYSGLLFGTIEIDTVKETVNISNLSKQSLDEIETNITEYLIKEKQKYMSRK